MSLFISSDIAQLGLPYILKWARNLLHNLDR
jgi:hypothetical protein